MIELLAPPIRGLILDMDGVLWKDTAAIGDLPRLFASIQDLGLKVMLATNNGTLTVQQYLQKLAGFGVKLSASQIVTSANALAVNLSRTFPQKGAVYVVGETGVVSALREAGFSAITDPDDNTPVIAVVAGLDRSLSYGKLRRAMFAIRLGATFYGTNPDATFPTPVGPVPGAGSILAAIQTATGTGPIVIGKPSPLMFSLCAERMQLASSELMVIGDRLETDVAGGQAFGARTGLVLSGISTRAQAERWSPQPDLVAENVAELIGA